MRLLLACFCITFLFACNSGGGSGGAATDLAGYVTENIGGGVTYAVKKDGNGRVVEEGYTLNGSKSGAWTSYYPEDGRVKSISSYVNGALSGPYCEFSNRSQIEKKIGYKNNQYHGEFVTYKFGRPLKVVPYQNGVIEGTYKEYFDNGKIQKESDFSNGKKNGKLRYYDDEGNITMEYEYKNDEKISGGIINKKEGE